MHKKTITLMLALTLVAGGVSACGSDDDSTSSPAAADAADSGSDAGASGDATDSGNPDVQKYCDDVTALAEELKKVMADPTSGDVADLSAKATELTTSAAGLISANADDVDEINACTAELTAAMGG